MEVFAEIRQNATIWSLISLQRRALFAILLIFFVYLFSKFALCVCEERSQVAFLTTNFTPIMVSRIVCIRSVNKSRESWRKRFKLLLTNVVVFALKT